MNRVTATAALRLALLAALTIVVPATPLLSQEKASQQPVARASWKKLFDGKSLDGWKSANFGGEGEVLVRDARIEMDPGTPLTGITYTGVPPKTNYEISLEAMKVDGVDFFCALTFPVADSHCSFVVGGWAGAVVGLSSIDDRDASENDTTRFMAFKTGQWYRIRVRVLPARIQAWIDDKQVVNQDIQGRRISTRIEVDRSKPLGISAYETKSALRNIKIRLLDSSPGAPRPDARASPNESP